MNYFITHWQPTSGLFIGAAILAIYYYLHVKRRDDVVRWIAKTLFCDLNMSPSADGLFNVATSFLVMFGGISIVVAIYYLSNG